MAASEGTTGRRTATVVRETKETRVEVTLDIDGSGRASAKTGRSMWRSPVGVVCWTVATADHLPSFMRSVATLIV